MTPHSEGLECCQTRRKVHVVGRLAILLKNYYAAAQAGVLRSGGGGEELLGNSDVTGEATVKTLVSNHVEARSVLSSREAARTLPVAAKFTNSYHGRSRYNGRVGGGAPMRSWLMNNRWSVLGLRRFQELV